MQIRRMSMKNFIKSPSFSTSFSESGKRSTKSIVFLIKDDMVSGIDLIDGLDGNMY